MPTTFADLAPIRRVAVGDCSGPLGSGFDALARSAYTALLRAEWTQSADPPFLPVHDNGQTANKGIPQGDAWKCSYGYDAAARTERSACGAVCYTFALPADATAGTPANISTVALSLTGDRYLDAGVDLYLVPSASATPPSVADLLALTPVGTYCATSDQSPTPPNERHGVTEAVTATPGVSAQPYLHAALLLHNYTTNRGAWIEGGAMLEGAATTISFSREVAANSPVEILCDAGAIVSTDEADHICLSNAVLAPHYRLTYFANLTDYDGFAQDSDFPDFSIAARNLLLAPSVSTGTVGTTLGWYDSRLWIITSVGSVDFGRVSYRQASFAPTLTMAVRSAYAPSGRYIGIDLSEVAANIPLDAVAYLVSDPIFAIIPAASAVSSPAFWGARASSVESITNWDKDDKIIWASPGVSPAPTPPSTTSIAVRPLCAFSVAADGTTEGVHSFSSPVELPASDYPVTVLVAFRPGLGGTDATKYATVPESFSVKLVRE